MFKIKKLFIVEIEYDEITEFMFSDLSIEATIDNQLFEMKERGHISSYEPTEVYDLEGIPINKILDLKGD